MSSTLKTEAGGYLEELEEKVKNQYDIEVFSLSKGKAEPAISETEHRL